MALKRLISNNVNRGEPHKVESMTMRHCVDCLERLITAWEPMAEDLGAGDEEAKGLYEGDEVDVEALTGSGISGAPTHNV